MKHVTLPTGLVAVLLLHTNTGLSQTFEPDWPAPVGSVYALAYDSISDRLFVGGTFLTINGETRRKLAAYNAADGTLTTWAPEVFDANGGNATVWALAIDTAGRLIVGGDFAEVNGSPRYNLAAFDIATGELVADWHPDINTSGGQVNALAVDGDMLYVGGSFLSVAGIEQHNIGAVSLTDGTALPWPAQGTNLPVRSVLKSGSDVYVGGEFTTMQGQPRMRLAMLDAVSGALGDLNLNSGGYINGLSRIGNTIYMGGDFGQIGGETRARLAALDTGTGAVNAWDPTAGNMVYSVLANERIVYVGGVFNTVGGVPHTLLAVLDPLTGTPLPWAPLLQGTGNEPAVRAIATSGTKLFVGGDFQTVDSVEHRGLAVWNDVFYSVPERSALLPMRLHPNPTSGVLSLDLLAPQARTVEVVDHLGQRLLISASTNTLDVSALASGYYTVTVYDKAHVLLARAPLVKD